jgi:hypothetical protein
VVLALFLRGAQAPQFFARRIEPQGEIAAQRKAYAGKACIAARKYFLTRCVYAIFAKLLLFLRFLSEFHRTILF